MIIIIIKGQCTGSVNRIQIYKQKEVISVRVYDGGQGENREQLEYSEV